MFENTDNFDVGYNYYEDPLDKIFEAFDTDPNLIALDEISYLERANKAILRLEVLDVDKYIKVNELKPITNPTFFSAGGAPTSDGLLSNEIFGITQRDRAGTFAYIDLYEYFMDPSCYKTLCKLDSKIKFVASGMKKFKISSDGQLVEDPNGDTGLRWFKKNFDKLKFHRTSSRTRDVRIKYVMHNYKEGKLFLNKYIVIPAFYRDVNTSGKHTGVGQINTLYVHLITAAKALKENGDYGLSMADTTCFRIQETLKTIYDWFCGNTNDAITDKGAGLSGKFGIIRANMAYTSDYSSRLVLTAPELKAETVDDLMVNFDRSAIPLAAAAADFYPFMLFHMRKFFENMLLNNTTADLIFISNKTKSDDYVLPSNAIQYFNDDVLKDQLKKFVYSHDNRFLPVEIPNGKNPIYFKFTGRYVDPKTREVRDVEPVYNRRLTWVDVIYIAAKKATDGKQMAFTRYPYDDYFNTIYTGIEISSTTETEPLIIYNDFYRFYPKIRESDIGSSSSSKFVDTMQLSNLYLDGAGADYDGDTGQVKGSFFEETNIEIEKFRDSKANFITSGCENIRASSKEAIQSLFNFTLVLRQDLDKMTDPKF